MNSATPSVVDSSEDSGTGNVVTKNKKQKIKNTDNSSDKIEYKDAKPAEKLITPDKMRLNISNSVKMIKLIAPKSENKPMKRLMSNKKKPAKVTSTVKSKAKKHCQSNILIGMLNTTFIKNNSLFNFGFTSQQNKPSESLDQNTCTFREKKSITTRKYAVKRKMKKKMNSITF